MYACVHVCAIAAFVFVDGIAGNVNYVASCVSPICKNKKINIQTNTHKRMHAISNAIANRIHMSSSAALWSTN